VHLVFDYERLPIQQAVYFDTPDKRMIFAIPRDGITYVGTTDTLYTDSIDAPTISDKDIDYILAATNEMFPAAKLTKKDVVSGWAGLRPLIYEDGKSPSELSRKDEIIISESGLISIAGGKLTGYRLMAKKIVDLVGKNLLSYQKHVGDCKTKNYRLSGGELESRQEALDFIQKLVTDFPQIAEAQLTKWFYRYGKNTTEVIAHFQQTNDVVLAELAYCFENEMIANDVDFLVRRTGFLFFDIRQAKTATMPTHAFLQQKLPQSLLKFSIDEELSKVAVD
jgi:glycerol-3-phosphate dehydrogenase